MSTYTNIKLRRLELNMSQQDLAIAIGYKSRSSIAKIEAGEVDLPLSKLNDFACALDTPLRNLMFGEFDAESKTSSGSSNQVPLNKRNKNIAVVLAGGKSTRNLKNTPNQFINVLGKPVITYCLETLQNHPLIDEICVVCLKGWEDVVSAYALQYAITKMNKIIPGGPTGVQSAKKAIDFLSLHHNPEDVVLFQESTRPLVTAEVLSRIINACNEKGNAAAYQSMRDYVQFDRNEGTLEYLDRDSVIALQLPEAYTLGFASKIFAEAEASKMVLNASWFGKLVYDLGYELNLVEGSENNIKIVRQEDIATFASLAKLIES